MLADQNCPWYLFDQANMRNLCEGCHIHFLYLNHLELQKIFFLSFSQQETRIRNVNNVVVFFTGLSQNDEYVGKLISPETITANGGHVFRWIKTNWGIS